MRVGCSGLPHLEHFVSLRGPCLPLVRSFSSDCKKHQKCSHRAESTETPAGRERASSHRSWTSADVLTGWWLRAPRRSTWRTPHWGGRLHGSSLSCLLTNLEKDSKTHRGWKMVVDDQSLIWWTLATFTSNWRADQIWDGVQEVDHTQGRGQIGGIHYIRGHHWDEGHICSIKDPIEDGECQQEWERVKKRNKHAAEALHA